MPRRLGTLLGLWLLCACALAAVPERPRLRIVGAGQGLPSTAIKALARDRDGYLWVATADGLARHDGVGMRLWRHQPGDPRGLPGNNVQALLVDARDRVWVATEGGGNHCLTVSIEINGLHHLAVCCFYACSHDAWSIQAENSGHCTGSQRYRFLHRCGPQTNKRNSILEINHTRSNQRGIFTKTMPRNKRWLATTLCNPQTPCSDTSRQHYWLGIYRLR